MSIDDMFLRDPNVIRLATLCGWSVREARGCLLDIWAICYDRETPLLSEDMVLTTVSSAPTPTAGVATPPDFAKHLVTAGLARRHRSGQLRISGVEKRITYLVEKRESGRQGGVNSANKRKKDPKHPGKHTSSTPDSTPQAPGNPSVPDVVPDVAIASASVTRASRAPSSAGASRPPAGAGEPTGSARDVAKAGIVRKVGPEHAKAFARVKQAIGSTAMGPSAVDSFSELRSLLDSFETLDGVEGRCMHAIAVREAEASSRRTLRWFGGAMWKRSSFDHAMALEIADVNGTRAKSSDAPRDPRVGRAPIATPEQIQYDIDHPPFEESP
jgi:hypothetical protein